MKASRLIFFACVVLGWPAPALAQDQPPTSSTYNETRISSLEEQMRALNGRIEQVEFAIRRLDQTLQRAQSDNDARLTHLEQAESAAAAAAAQAAAAPPPPQVFQPVPSQTVVPLSQPPVNGQSVNSSSVNSSAVNSSAVNTPSVDPTGTLGALKMQNGKVTGGINNPQSAPLPSAPPDYGLTPQEQYERAFSLLRQANYADAEQAFKSFIDKNPKDKLIDNAKYWYGETLYVRARFDEAAIAFADAYQQNTQGTKATDSLLKLAMSLGALNKIPDACVTLSELKTKYPNAAPTIKSRADDERTRLKCPIIH